MTTRPVPPIALQFLRGAEGCPLRSYRDTGGKWTAGVGHTGPDVLPDMQYTQEQADAWLVADADIAAGRLAQHVTEYELLKLDEHQYAALISFVFNLGAGNWQIWNFVNSDQLSLVPSQIIRFDHGVENGVLVEIPGLKHRRLAEIALWNTPDAVAAIGVIGDAPTPSSGYMRDIATPPAPPAPKPLANVSLTTKVVTGLTGVGAGAAQVQAIVQPHASESHYFGEVAVGLSGIIVVAAVLALMISHKQTVVAAT